MQERKKEGTKKKKNETIGNDAIENIKHGPFAEFEVQL